MRVPEQLMRAMAAEAEAARDARAKVFMMITIKIVTMILMIMILMIMIMTMILMIMPLTRMIMMTMDTSFILLVLMKIIRRLSWYNGCQPHTVGMGVITQLYLSQTLFIFVGNLKT